MNIMFMFLVMILLHIVDDFYLQGILATMKQKDWWRKQEWFNKLYEDDWVTALIEHAFSWTFMVMLPIAWYYYHFQVDDMFVIGFFINTTIHAIIDHLKANNKMINLYTDQFIHLIQIIATLSIYGMKFE